MSTLLLEIGCEELPAGVCRSIGRQLSAAGGLVDTLLRAARLQPASPAAAPSGAPAGEAISVLISPRRIAVVVAGVPDHQTPETQTFRGPRAAVAFGPDGAPTTAGLGFAKSRGVAPRELLRRVIDGTELAVAEVEAERLPARDVIPGLAARLIAGIQIPRGMRWGARPAGQSEYLRFSRPIRWLACKLDHETIAFPFYDMEAGDVTQGHRVLGSPVILDTADHYQRHLREQKVIADQDERRQAIEAGLAQQAAGLDAEWFDPGSVLEEAVYLVEWPSVHRGSFDRRHLRLPPEVLITAMQGHQRYFPLRAADGALLPAFLYVSNAAPEAAAIVTRGNEQVLEGRLDDAEFSYDRDVQEGLAAMADKLSAVTFHEKLGSLAAKTERIEKLADQLVTRAGAAGDDLRRTVATVARYAKADLVSQMVQEFPVLQGRMGGRYATAAGMKTDVAQAIAEHYLPLSATAPVPASLAGALVAIADKADNIAGAWLTGERPSGSRDPYGLRRAATGIVRIALEFSLRFGVGELAALAVRGYADQGIVPTSVSGMAPAADVEIFIRERLEALLLEEGLPFALVEAALASGADDVPARAARARTFAALEGRPHFVDVVTAYNRCAPLVAKAGAEAGGAVDPARFSAPAEAELHDAVAAAREPLLEQLEHLEIESAIAQAAALRPVVDRYFDDVLVMDPDPAIRANRLAQLNEVTNLLGALGDFGRLPVQQTD